MMRRLALLLTYAMILTCLPVLAQLRPIRGTVISAADKEPLIGVSVVVKGTTRGVMTDLDGHYSIEVSNGETLLFSYIGMTSIDEKVTAEKSQINILMEDDSKQIEEVVVVAYGVRKKGTLTGSVSVIKAESIENTPTASFDQALQGKTPGLQVMQNSGEPSAPASFQIRGVNSINAGTTPLFIMDGLSISAEDFAAINPNDIESFSVLKDAGSTSIYGARAANGVVVITTKRGKMGEKGKLTFRGQYGFSNLAYGNWNQMNTTQRLDYEEQIGLRVPGQYDREALERVNINWRDIVFNNNAPMQTYELSGSGATKGINYFVSGAYYSQEGIAKGSDFTRYNLRANLEARLNPWLKMGTNTALSYEEVHEADEGEYSTVTPISASRFMLPYWNPYQKDGSLSSVNDGTWLGSNQNPLEWLDNNPYKRNRAKVFTNVFLELTPIEGLTLRTLGGLDGEDTRVDMSTNPSYVPNYGSGGVGKSFSRAYNMTWTNTANYTHTFNDNHNMTILLGQELLSMDQDAFSVSTRGQSNDKLLTMSTGTSVTNWGDSRSESNYLSYFMRGDYSYQDKYYADFSLRRDGSSKFGKNSKWATFGSAGLMWNMKAEDFLSDYTWLDNAQLLASVGTSGNSSIPNYIHSALYSAGPQYAGMTGLAPYSRGNSDLTWEKLRTINFGLKLGLFNRFNLSAEFYDKKTTDMLMEVPITFGNGFSSKWDNIGAMVNRGVEIDFNVDVVRTRDIVWNVFANASFNHNEITELYNGLDEYALGTSGVLLKVGHSYGEFYSVRYAGVNPINGDALWYTKDGELTNTYNNDDRVLVGKNYIAPWQGGFGTNVSYKGLSLSAQFSWVADRWMINNDRYFDESNGTYAVYNQSAELLNRWQKPGDITSIPRHGIQTEMDTHLLEDASFLRLKNLSLGYNLPANVLRPLKVVERIRVFGQAQNLLTFTKFTGMDPESSMNIYAASYPMSRQFSFGVEISF